MAVAGSAIAEASKVGRRGEREDLARPRIEHHDRAAVLAERLHGGLLERQHERRPEVLRVGRLGAELPGELAQRIRRHDPAQLRIPCVLESRRPVLARGIADDRRQRVRRVDPVRLAVLVALVPREPHAVAVEDVPAQHVARRGDHRRVVARAAQVGRFDDLPVARAEGEPAERERENERDATERGADSDASSGPGRRGAGDRVGVRGRLGVGAPSPGRVGPAIRRRPDPAFGGSAQRAEPAAAARAAVPRARSAGRR